MAKKKRKHRSQPFGRYATVVRQGKELLDRFWNGEKLERHGRYERVHKHYSREPVQQAMYEYARGRRIAALRDFRPLFPGGVMHPEDILALAFYFVGRGKLWPSLHGTISRNIDGQKLLDLVMEVDFKSNWKVAFESARPLITFLQDFGVDLKVKFSGHSSPHIIIPAEAFPPGVGHRVHVQILDYVNKYVKGRAHLDMSFRSMDHFLRLAYSINEQAGRVSVPIDPDRYDTFTPKEHAEIERVNVMKDWWSVPPDAPERTSEMLKFILERKSIFIPKRMKKTAAKQFKRLPTEVIIAAGEKAREDALRKLQMPYEQMLKTGQQMFQRRDELMEKSNVREALDMLRDIHKRTGVVSTQEASSRYEVPPEDLWFLWRWTLREHIFDYYAREDVQGAMFLHSIDRKVRLGREDVVVDLADPDDILPLAAYIHETQGGIDYPTFYGTTIKQDVTTGDVIGCDVAVRIDGKGDGVTADRMARWALALLRQAGADFAILIGPEGDEQHPSAPHDTCLMTIRYLIIPSEAVPGMPHNKEEFRSVIEAMERHFKKALPRSEGISVLPMGEYIPLFYSVNETSGAANIPVRADKLDAEPELGSLRHVQVIQDWWDIPGEASAEMEELFRKVAKS